MPELSRIVLVRHGETVGRSSIRFYGSTDVALSAEGCAQMRRAARAVVGKGVGLVVASPLGRAWKAATIVAPGLPVRLEPGFREIDFGRWEGLTREEIEARDPVLYRDWQAGTPGFEFPGGERRASFRTRIRIALEGLLACAPTHRTACLIGAGTNAKLGRYVEAARFMSLAAEASHPANRLRLIAGCLQLLFDTRPVGLQIRL